MAANWCGKNEAIRILDALTHFEQNGEVCPADWRQGEAAMEASFSGVADYFSAN